MDGVYGFPQDMDRALELWHRAGELGHPIAYNNIGNAYEYGRGVERDIKKAVHYWEVAAMGGHEMARHNLGNNEIRAGNFDRALRNYMIAARGGYTGSLQQIQSLYAIGHATKDDYTAALRSYQAYLGEIKSPQRDKAAQSHERYRYYESGV